MDPVVKTDFDIWSYSYENESIILSVQNNGRLNIWDKLATKAILDININGRIDVRINLGVKCIRSNGSFYVL